MDPTPVILREELAIRARGYTFAQAWRPAVSRAVRDLASEAAAWWVTVFAEQREVWCDNYSLRRARDIPIVHRPVEAADDLEIRR